MKLEIIAGSCFVREGVTTRPYRDVLSGLHARAIALAVDIDARTDALKAARAALACSLADGTEVDREAVTAAETALAAAHKQLAAVRAQLRDLLEQHARATDKQRLAAINADLAGLGRTFDTQLKRVAA